MKNLLKKFKNKEGFTLAELLIVVAVIAILVAISIPVFSSQLEKAREAVDAANIRAAYAECMTSIITEGDGADLSGITVELKQTKEKWQNEFDFPENLDAAAASVEPGNGGTVSFNYDPADGKLKTSIKLKPTP